MIARLTADQLRAAEMVNRLVVFAPTAFVKLAPEAIRLLAPELVVAMLHKLFAGAPEVTVSPLPVPMFSAPRPMTTGPDAEPALVTLMNALALFEELPVVPRLPCCTPVKDTEPIAAIEPAAKSAVIRFEPVWGAN